MIQAAAVLAVMLHQAPCWADRGIPPEVKRAQLESIASAIAQASPTPERAALLLTIGYHESRWCIRVHSGQRRGGHGEGLWQLEGRHHGPGARSGLSVTETLDAARLASAQLGHSYQCGSSPAAILTAYAGRPCVQASGGWRTLDARVQGYWWALGALTR